MNRNNRTVFAHGYPREYANKNKRNRMWSQYQYVPFIIKKNEILNVIITGETNEKVFAVIGLPSDSENMVKIPLINGSNSFQATKEGILSFVNNNYDNNVDAEITSEHQRIPFFNLSDNTNEDFAEEMNTYQDAPLVLLSNKLSDIIVTYSSGKKYIKNVTKLMENFDVIIDTENRVTGSIIDGKADYKLDPNRNLHLEVYHSYMYATNEYTGYNESQDAMPQLLGLSNDRWGVWHENGHQRQQYPWEWSAGKGLTEVTNNILSLSVQEVITGRASRIDEVKTEIENFVNDNSQDKSYDDQDLFIKVGLFWQLKLAFGDHFYPQLYQLYRLMQNTPPQDDNKGQKQLLIRTVSKLVNINLSPFFMKWGLGSDIDTMTELSFLPTLTKPIWENNNDNYHTLEMPEEKYIPELIYLKNSITNVTITASKIKFLIDKNWYSPYHFYFNVNGNYIGEVNEGQNYYCIGVLTNDGYEVTRDFSENELLSDNDVFSIYIDYEGHHEIYYSSIELNNLWHDIQNIYSDINMTKLKVETDQQDIDDLWNRYNTCIGYNNDAIIEFKNKIIQAQQLLLSDTIKKDGFDGTNFVIEFKNASFLDYNYSLKSNNILLAKLEKGIPTNSSLIDDLLWQVPVSFVQNSELHIIVNILDQDFLVKVEFYESLLFQREIDNLYSDNDNTVLKSTVDQNEINALRNEILASQLPFWNKDLLLSYLGHAQKLYLSMTIEEVYQLDNAFYVKFSDDTIFRNYRYMLFSKSDYLSEVSYGQNYYSSLNDQVWKTDLHPDRSENLIIKVFVNDDWYVIYSE